MSTKRKQSVGGYVPSSDDEEDASPAPTALTAPTAKKPRVAPAASSGLTAPAFNQPKAASTRAASIPPRPTLSTPAAAKSTQQLGQKGPVAEVRRTALLTPRTTPNPPTRSSGVAETRPNHRPTGLELSSDDSDTAMPPASPVESRGKEKTRAPEPTPLPGPSQPASRRPYAFELAALSNEIAECMRKDEYEDMLWELQSELKDCKDELKRSKEGLAELTSRFDVFVAQHTNASAAIQQPQSVAPNTSSTAVTPAPTAEPITTPGLDWNPEQELERYVPVSDLQTIRGLLTTYVPREKSARALDPDPALKKHLRKSFYNCLDHVEQANEIKAPYFDGLGKHVMFPPELADPTGHIRPYPNWLGSLESQAELFALVINRARSSLPGTSTASIQVRTVTEKILIECLITGVWNTCVSEWRKIANGKTALNADQIRQNVRQRKRVENKALELADARTEMPELADKQFDGLFHVAMLSAEESEGEGPDAVICVKEPSNRSRFVNAVYQSAKERTKLRRMSLPGNSYQPRKRKRVYIKTDNIPDLKHNGDLPKIPAFAFGSKWRKANETLIAENSHRIDLALTKPPDLTPFFLKYPVPSSDDEDKPASKKPLPRKKVHEESWDAGYDGEEEGVPEGDGGADYEGYGGGDGEDEGQRIGDGKGKENQGNDQDQGNGQEKGEGNYVQGTEESSNGSVGHFHRAPRDVDMQVIDPSLRPDAPQRSLESQHKPASQETPDNAPTSAFIIKIPPFNLSHVDLPQPHPDHGKAPSIQHSDAEETSATGAQVASGNEPEAGGSVQEKGKGGGGKRQKGRAAGGKAPGEQAALVDNQLEPKAKRRGRPPKHKK